MHVRAGFAVGFAFFFNGVSYGDVGGAGIALLLPFGWSGGVRSRGSRGGGRIRSAASDKGGCQNENWKEVFHSLGIV